MSLPEPLLTLPAWRIDGGGRRAVQECVLGEVPVALMYNGVAHAVMMATPSDLGDLALGFALTEGVVATASEFSLADLVAGDDGIRIDAVIPQERFDALSDRRRLLSGRSGCGVCGIESLAAAIRPVPRLDGGGHWAAAGILAGLECLAAGQPLNAASGGAHAAAFIAGDRAWIREDIGRHNALDKVVGALATDASAPPAGHGFLAITSRASYEIVHKAACAGIPLVAAISAPSTLAIRLADEAGLTLVAFARGQSMTVYSHPQRLA